MRFILIFQLVPFVIFSQTPYKLNKINDVGFVVVGLATLGVGYYLDSQVEPFTIDRIKQLNRNEINAFDRSAVKNWSPNLSIMSGALVLTFGALPSLFLTSKKMRMDYKTITILYFETISTSLGTNLLGKGLIKRTRPFVYNPDAPLLKKIESKARKSFYSDHTSIAFASAIFAAKLYGDYYPNSRWKTVIWISSLLGASTVGYLRYESGKHFPSDVFAGAAAGSLAGYLIPHLHQKKNNSITFFTQNTDNSYYFRLCAHF